MIIKTDKNENHRIWGALGLSMKAGALAVGDAKATEAIRGGKASLIILSNDASANTEKKFSDMGKYRNIPVIKLADRNRLGTAIGRSFAVVIAVCSEGFSAKITEILSNGDNEN